MAKPEDLFRIYEGRIMGAEQMEQFAKLADIANSMPLTPEMQKIYTQATTIYGNQMPIFQNAMPVFAGDILPTLRYLQNAYPKLYADISGTLTVETKPAKPKHRHKAIKKAQKIMLRSQYVFDDFMLRWQSLPEGRFNTIMSGLLGIIDAADQPLKTKLLVLWFSVIILFVSTHTTEKTPAENSKVRKRQRYVR